MRKFKDTEEVFGTGYTYIVRQPELEMVEVL